MKKIAIYRQDNKIGDSLDSGIGMNDLKIASIDFLKNSIKCYRDYVNRGMVG